MHFGRVLTGAMRPDKPFGGRLGICPPFSLLHLTYRETAMIPALPGRRVLLPGGCVADRTVIYSIGREGLSKSTNFAIAAVPLTLH